MKNLLTFLLILSISFVPILAAQKAEQPKPTMSIWKKVALASSAVAGALVILVGGKAAYDRLKTIEKGEIAPYEEEAEDNESRTLEFEEWNKDAIKPETNYKFIDKAIRKKLNSTMKPQDDVIHRNEKYILLAGEILKLLAENSNTITRQVLWADDNSLLGSYLENITLEDSPKDLAKLWEGNQTEVAGLVDEKLVDFMHKASQDFTVKKRNEIIGEINALK